MKPKKPIDLASQDGMTNLRRAQLEALKSRPDYTQQDAIRDHAAGNVQALLEAAYRIADGAAAQYAKLSGFKPPPAWFADAREHACEKAQGWRPETKYRGLPIEFPKFIMRAVKQWCDRERGKYNNEKADVDGPAGALVILDVADDEYRLEQEAILNARSDAGDIAAAAPTMARDHDDAPRLNPKDDGQEGGRQDRITRPVTARYRAPKYDATDEPGVLEMFLATIPGPVDRDVAGRWLRGSRPGTAKAVRRYATQGRPKGRFTDKQRLEFANQVWELWKEFREFAAQHVFTPPVWNIETDAAGVRHVALPPGLTPTGLAESPALLLSLAAALDLGTLTERYWLAAHPGKLPKHFTNEFGQMLYEVKKLVMPPGPRK